MRCALVLATTVGLAVVAPTPARADGAQPSAEDIAAARALFVQATKDERAGRWADALVKIRRATAVKVTPGLRFHIALCNERLGHLVQAAEDYAAARAAARAENNTGVLDLVDAPLADLKVRTPTITVSLPKRFLRPGAGAEVRIDGVTLPSARVGQPTPVDAGSHTVQATAPGETPYAMTLTVVERQAAALDIQFLPLGGILPPPVVVTTPAAAGPALVTKAPEPAWADMHAPPSRTLPIVATAVAVGLVGIGVGAYAIAGSDESYNRTLCQGMASPPCGNPTPTRAWDATALGAWIAAAGVGAAAVVLWVRQPGTSDSGHAELRAGPGSLVLGGTF